MPTVTEGSLIFDFPADWRVTKYDDWVFYRNQFQRVCGPKAADILAIDVEARRTWIIEVKDYRANRRTKPIDLAEEVALKVRDTLAGLAAAQVNANDNEEKDFARKALRPLQFRVVLHLEQPTKTSRLFPTPIKPADVKQKLKTLVKPIDPHPLVVGRSTAHPIEWTVTCPKLMGYL